MFYANNLTFRMKLLILLCGNIESDLLLLAVSFTKMCINIEFFL